MSQPIISDRIYISGPMSSLSRKEYLSRFKLAEELLRKHGYRNIVNPCRVWACRFPWLYKLIGYRLTLFYDIWLLTHCQRIYKIPGWRLSRGCQMESCVAYHFKVFTLAKTMSDRLDNMINEQFNPSECENNRSLRTPSNSRAQ